MNDVEAFMIFLRKDLYSDNTLIIEEELEAAFLKYRELYKGTPEQKLIYKLIEQRKIGCNR